MYPRTQLSPSAYFFEVIRINVSTEGFYQFYSDGTVEIIKYLYDNSFTPSNPRMNLLYEDSYWCWNNQFQMCMSMMLRPGVYVLVVTTYELHTIGPFSVNVRGPRSIIFEQFNRAWNSSKSSLLKQCTWLFYRVFPHRCCVILFKYTNIE
jgi:hypothetical protein